MRNRLFAGFAVIFYSSFPAGAQTPAAVEEAGFIRIFDGQTLKGWDGDPAYWRVENNAITGEIVPDKPAKQNSFIIWRGGELRDFELKLDYRVSAMGNSGVNYRSTEMPGVPFAMRGYQLDIDGVNRNKAGLRHTGQNYEERGRTFLALRGQMAGIETGKKPHPIAAIRDRKELEAAIKDDWNELHIIARGNVLIHILNGQTMSVVIDDDVANRRMDGLLGMQVHVGPPMKIEYRNIRVKMLEPSTGSLEEN